MKNSVKKSKKRGLKSPKYNFKKSRFDYPRFFAYGQRGKLKPSERSKSYEFKT